MYSTSPLSSSACVELKKLLAEGDDSPATDLGEVLRRLYSIAAKPHAAFDSVRNVFFQVYRTPSSLRPLRLPWGIVEPASRQWNLSCEIFRTGTESGTTIPRICIALLAFDDGRAIKHGPWSKSANKIAVQIFTDMKPLIFQRGVEEQVEYTDGHENSPGFIQPIVDDILSAMAQVSAARDFDSPLQLIERLKDAILSYLKTSALRPLTDFQNLEIIIMDPNRQRHVSNILLSSDGGERYSHDDASFSQLPSLEEDKQMMMESGNKINRVVL